MKTPGIGNRKKRFKKLLGWGKKKVNERKRNKPVAKKRTKLSRKLRRKRIKRH